ncbi:hypothetical protein [Tsukamurella sp. 1534]|uniref:hypothetical protein n=1 Tax=Tsukamurella sp. 1534 TaxID=1151061 RepID=UPI0006ACAC88|nr:hypothetical protein [Tsukamurella sp. 1534]
MRTPAGPPATVRGAMVGLVSFGASLAAHAAAMAGATAGGTAGHSMPAGTGDPGSAAHGTHAMPGHAMTGGAMDHAAMGHAMAGHAMPGAAPIPAGPASTLIPAIPSTSILLLAAVCALLGVLAARPRAAGPATAGALVLAGQGAGHLALGVTMGHLGITPAMALAHVAAAAVAGAAIAGAEAALRLALAALRPISRTATVVRRTVVERDWTFRAAPLPVVTCHGALRAPPA